MNLLLLLRRHWILAAVSLTAAVFLFDAVWVPVKAELAQHLLERAWLRTLAGESNAKPWPWADTRAVAVLEVPRLGLREIVLEGSSGRNLAFGPTLVNTTRLDESADRVLSGHRDTHFSFLKELKTGDLLRLRTASDIREYRVSWQEAVDSREQQLVIDHSVDRLTLLTCYPFNAPTAGGPLRWVVTALPERSPSQSHPRDSGDLLMLP
jgi:sortase A